MPTPARVRVRSQLAIQVPPDLLERLRGASLAQRRTVTALVVEWIQAGLDGALPTAAAPAADPALLARLERLEAAVAALQHTPSPAPGSVPPSPSPPAAATLQPLPERRLTPAEAHGLMTGAEVAAALGLAGSGTGLRDWIRKRGADAVGGVYRGFRLRGKGQLPGARQPVWLWERVGDEA